jgi:hypothetical protein
VLVGKGGYKMKAEIIMVIDGEEYVYGRYPFETYGQRDKVNELAMKVRDERGVDVYVHRCA